jgi:hypothetical protein
MHFMASLAVTNKHLSSPAKRAKAVRLTISTSSAIEGIYAPFREKTTAGKGNSAPAKAAKRR